MLKRTLPDIHSPCLPFESAMSHKAAECPGSKVLLMGNFFALSYAARCFFTIRLPIIAPIKAATITPAIRAADHHD